MNRYIWKAVLAAVLLLVATPGTAAADTPDSDAEPTEKAEKTESDAPTGDSKQAAEKTAMGEAIVIDYDGKIQDGEGKPISGVFKLSFKLYKSEDAANPVWQEQRYVGVVDGSYTVALGETRPMERRQIPEEPWISIDMVGEGELVRDRLEVPELDTGDDDDQKAISAETKKLLEKASEESSVAFADVAQRAVQADNANKAEQADKLGEMSAQEIKDLSNLALERLGDHIADPNAHEAAGGVRLGTERQVTNSAGGSGGSSYELNCPPGFVVVGVRGGAGRLLDSISLICKPLR